MARVQGHGERPGSLTLDDLAGYERYRRVLREDPESRANFDMARSLRFILREERSWLEDVVATRGLLREVTP